MSASDVHAAGVGAGPLEPVPPPPRRARWRSVLLRNAWLAVLGGALVLFAGGLLAPWVATLPAQFEDLALDAAARQADGEVVAVVPDARRIAGTRWDLVRYRFGGASTGAPAGESWVPHPAPAAFAPGRPIVVELLGDRPEVNRVLGTSRTPAPARGKWLVSAALLGVVILLWWFRGALKLKVALADGSVVTARVGDVRLLRWIWPVLVQVRYSFTSDDGVEHAARQWLPARSPLGRMLLGDTSRGAGPLLLGDHDPTVIYDPRRPRRSRLVSAADFVA